MLRKLKQEIFSNPTQKLLEKAKVDKSHQFLHPKYILQISRLCLQPKSRNQLLNFLSKSFNSESTSLKIKSLIIIHACVKIAFDQEILEFVQSLQTNNQKINSNSTEQSQQNVIKNYLIRNAIDYYLIYIKKICAHKETFLFMKRFIDTNLAMEGRDDREHHAQIMQRVSHGFNILNFAHYLIGSEVMFNKMGRYYRQYQQIVSMYIQFLTDMDLYNSFLCKSINKIIAKNNIQPYLKKDLQKIRGVGLKKSENKIQRQPLNSDQNEQTKHFFLYISESQKIIDRLYQFFHNRYFFKQVKSMFIFPTFLSIAQKDYQKLVKQTRMVDKRLVHQVKMSKYEHQINVTECSFNDEIKNENMPTAAGNHTMMQVFSTKKTSLETSLYFQDNAYSPQNKEESPKIN